MSYIKKVETKMIKKNCFWFVGVLVGAFTTIFVGRLFFNIVKVKSLTSVKILMLNNTHTLSSDCGNPNNPNWTHITENWIS